MRWNSNKLAQQQITAEIDYKNALDSYIGNCLDANQFTPDLWQLEQKKSHLVFIHDDMMMTQPNHDLVKNGSLSGFYPLNYGYTTRKFTFVKKELHDKSFPIAIDIREKDNLPHWMAKECRIRGEIYAIRPMQFIALDNHRQNGVQFKRVKVNINIGYRKLMKHTITDSRGKAYSEFNLCREEMTTQEMFMYVGREEYWKDQLESGFFNFSPVEIIEEDRLWLTKYYQYSRIR